MSFVGYELVIQQQNKATLTFGKGKQPNDAEFTINKDMTTGVYEMEGRLYGLSNDTARVLSFSNLLRPQQAVSLSTIYDNSTNTCFNGLISGTPSFSPDDSVFTFNAVSYDIRRGLTQVAIKSGNTFYGIKKAFATAMNLALSTNVSTDMTVLQYDYNYYGTSPLSELTKFFKNENVYIYANTLFFSSKKEKSKLKYNVIDITKYITKASYGDSPNRAVFVCQFCPFVVPGDNVSVKFSSNYPFVYSNFNSTYMIEKVEHKINATDWIPGGSKTTIYGHSSSALTRF